jgi:hypothetical protein
MPTIHRRLAVAGMLTAAAIAVPAAALAAGSDSSHPKPQHPRAAATASGKSESAPADLSALASSAGISVNRLEAGLAAAKRAGGNNTAGVAAFAAATGMSNATAHRIVNTVFGPKVNGSLTGPAATGVLASHLGVSRSAAQRALDQIAALSAKNGIRPTDAAFAQIAHGLGVSPARLAAGLDAVKQSMAGK